MYQTPLLWSWTNALHLPKLTIHKWQIKLLVHLKPSYRCFHYLRSNLSSISLCNKYSTTGTWRGSSCRLLVQKLSQDYNSWLPCEFCFPPYTLCSLDSINFNCYKGGFRCMRYKEKLFLYSTTSYTIRQWTFSQFFLWSYVR